MIQSYSYSNCNAQSQNNYLLSYLQYAREQKIELSSIEGFIIFDDSQQEIPQYIIFIPTESKKASFEQKLSDSSTIGYVVYFQGIRWILPNLEDIVKSLNYTVIKYGILKKDFKMSYGRFTFDKTQKGDPDLKVDDTIIKVPVQVNTKTFQISIMELPESIGVPKLFEKADMKL